MIRRLRVLPILFVALLLAACTGEDPGGEDEQATDDGGEQPEVVILFADAPAQLVCPANGGAIEFVARRVDCWDPPLPCTLAQNPPWIVGTVNDCSALSDAGQLGASLRWQVEVAQTGRWEVRLQSPGASGEPAQAISCFGVDGVSPTNVARDDLTNRAEFMLTGAPSGQCGEP